MTTSEDQGSQANEPELFRVTKVCRECGAVFKGYSFRPLEGDTPGTCNDCVDRYDQEVRRFASKRKEEEDDDDVPEIQMPTVTSEDYDRRYC
jgi:hypothetical protein